MIRKIRNAKNPKIRKFKNPKTKTVTLLLLTCFSFLLVIMIILQSIILKKLNNKKNENEISKWAMCPHNAKKNKGHCLFCLAG